MASSVEMAWMRVSKFKPGESSTQGRMLIHGEGENGTPRPNTRGTEMKLSWPLNSAVGTPPM
jgi:hypothetical protein